MGNAITFHGHAGALGIHGLRKRNGELANYQEQLNELRFLQIPEGRNMGTGDN